MGETCSAPKIQRIRNNWISQGERRIREKAPEDAAKVESATPLGRNLRGPLPGLDSQVCGSEGFSERVLYRFSYQPVIRLLRMCSTLRYTISRVC